MQIKVVWLAVISCTTGCFRPQPETVDAETAQIDSVIEDRELANSDWVIVDWAAKDLGDPLPHSQADLEIIEDGVRATTLDRRGQAHLIHRRELLDEFEIKVRIIQPSVAELSEQGTPRPSLFSSRVGFRGPGGQPRFRVSLKRDRSEHETDEVTIRASKQHLSFRINDDLPRVMRRSRMTPGHFFVELSKNSQISVVGLDIREGLEPDPELVAAAENATESGPGGGWPGTMPPGFVVGPMGPMPPMFGPSFINPTAATALGKPPAPSRLEPIVSEGPWSVPKLGNATLDAAIAGDLRLEPMKDGLAVAKTSASGGFWMISLIRRSGDFVAVCRVSVPSMHELASIADPSTLLAVGAYSAEGVQQGVLAPAPTPLPTDTREFTLKIRRDKGRVTVDVAGAPVGGSAMIDQAVVLGLYLRGGIRLSIQDFEITPVQAEPVSSSSENSVDVQEGVKPPATRVWTDATGVHQVEATVVRLEGDNVHLRRRDGKAIVVSLETLSPDDQKIVKKLASP